MYRQKALLGLFLFTVGGASFASSVDIAEYYLNRQDFKQALELFAQSEDPRGILRVADLKFLLQGRNAARETLLNYLEKNKSISPELRLQIQSKLDALLSVFVSDEGQSEFYRAQTKIRHGDWVSAELLLESAITKEEGNSLVLELKAQCEKELRKFTEYVSTLGLLVDTNPYSIKNIERLAEGYFSENENAKVISVLSKATLEKKSYGKLLYLVAQAELGKISDLDGLEELADTYPIALYYLGKELIKNEEDKTDAIRNFSAFLEKTALVSLPNWDPFKTAEKIAEAKKHISQ